MRSTYPFILSHVVSRFRVCTDRRCGTFLVLENRGEFFRLARRMLMVCAMWINSSSQRSAESQHLCVNQDHVYHSASPVHVSMQFPNRAPTVLRPGDIKLAELNRNRLWPNKLPPHWEQYPVSSLSSPTQVLVLRQKPPTSPA